MFQIKTPLTNAQMELLKLFAFNMTDDEVSKLKQTLAHFYADRAMHEAGEVWQQKGWTAEDMNRLLNSPDQ